MHNKPHENNNNYLGGLVNQNREVIETQKDYCKHKLTN